MASCGAFQPRGTQLREFARTLNLSDVRTGWVFTRTMGNNAHTHVLASLRATVRDIPYAATGLDFDNGNEFPMRWIYQ